MSAALRLLSILVLSGMILYAVVEISLVPEFYPGRTLSIQDPLVDNTTAKTPFVQSETTSRPERALVAPPASPKELLQQRGLNLWGQLDGSTKTRITRSIEDSLEVVAKRRQKVLPNSPVPEWATLILEGREAQLYAQLAALESGEYITLDPGSVEPHIQELRHTFPSNRFDLMGRWRLSNGRDIQVMVVSDIRDAWLADVRVRMFRYHDSINPGK